MTPRDHFTQLSDADLAEVLRLVAEVSKKVYQPGVFKCAKCGFSIVQSTLNTNSGAVTARDEPGEKCPNDGSPMWRVTYQEDNAKAWAWGEEQFDRAKTAEAENARLLAAAREMREASEARRMSRKDLRILNSLRRKSTALANLEDRPAWKRGHERDALALVRALSALTPSEQEHG